LVREKKCAVPELEINYEFTAKATASRINE